MTEEIAGCFFPVEPFSRQTCEVLVKGKPRKDYRLFREDGTGKTMIYFDSMSADEEASVAIRRRTK